MKKITLLTGALLLTGLAGAGCGGGQRIPVVPPRGLIYTKYRAPLVFNFDKNAVSRKKGYGETEWLNWPYVVTSFGFGDVTIKKIADQAGLSEIDYVDYEYLSVLGVYRKVQIIPYGR